MAFAAPFFPCLVAPGTSRSPLGARAVRRSIRSRVSMHADIPPDSSPVYPDDSRYYASGGGDDIDDSPSPDTIDATVRDVPLAELKCQLYAAISTLNRGLAASPDARADIMLLVEELERFNPIADPADKPDVLCGRWRLVFTNALDVLSLGLLAPVALIAEVYQNIAQAEDKEWDFDVDNIVQLEPPFASVSNSFFGRTMSTITVKARGVKKSSSRLDITFVDSSFKPQSVGGYEIPSALPALVVPLGRPVGYIETTFLDEDLRIVRAPPLGGTTNYFVLMREQ